MKTDTLDLRLADCMELMREFADGHFDLAIVDPPYGIGESGSRNASRRKFAIAKDYKPFAGDDLEAPPIEFFDELRRVSKNQIIWGANHFIDRNPIGSPGWIFWHKKDATSDFADGELAWTSFRRSLRYFRFLWAGMWQEDMGNKEARIHPTQKPVALYRWVLANYAKPGQRILDTHLGSGSIAIACHYFGAHLTACEIDPDYFAAACERIERETRQADMFQPRVASPTLETPSLL